MMRTLQKSRMSYKTNLDLLLYINQMKSLVIAVVCTTLIFTLALGQQQVVGYPCNIPNCQTCSFTNFCGLCNSNYMLQINSTTSQPYCQQLTCTDPNCQTCYQNNICGICNSGFYVGSNGVCVSGTAPTTCSTGCLSCNATACLLCSFGYNLQNGGCFPNNGNSITNCMSTFSSYACQFCKANYIVTPSYQCFSNPGFICGITNCALCIQAAGTTTCKTCLPGFTSNGANGCMALPCSTSNCLTCTDASTCSACLPGYYLSTTTNQCSLKYYNCGISNCLYCQSSGICSQCSAGYSVTLFTQAVSSTQTVTLGSACNQITSSNGGSVVVSNCLQYGPMIPGTSSLVVGCVSCQPNYVNVGGYCMPNVLVTSFTCNIANCQYCVQNNVCGQCASGYTAFAGTGNVCTPNYSPIPNCLLTPPYIPGGTPICSMCANGYALVDNIACVLIPTTNIICNITNCDFCITNNTCQACLSGYSLDSNVCTATCTVANCQTCSNNLNCQTCAYGYYLSQNQCLSAANQPQTYCSSTFGACSACSYYACTTCSTGNSLNTVTGKCCPTPNYNIANCASYSTTWSPTACTATFTCTQCNFGTFILVPYPGATPQCTQLPCSIANCSYCYMNDLCVLCNQGFTLVNGICTAYTVPSTCTTQYCTACNSSNVCTSCLNGYILYNGQCVCQFQNCLTCQGNAFCTQCAFPTIATITSTAGCLPPISPNTLCTIPNCINCLSVNTCAQCDNGFTLQVNGSCIQNTCNRMSNCLLCSFNQQICYVCNPGFIQSTLFGSNCTAIASNYSCQVSGCAVCNSQSSTQCQTCSPFFFLNNNTCTPYSCVANCVACLSNNTCLTCQVGFYLASGNPPSCVVDPAVTATTACPTGANKIAGCTGCQNVQSTTICVMCEYGLQPAQGGQTCVPQTCSVPNCQICLQNKMANNGLQLCLVCQQGYFINSYFQCVSYNPALSAPNCTGIYNCLYCGYNNSCDYCSPGWNPINGVCLTTIGCTVANCAQCSSPSVCYSCATNYQLSTNNVCILTCNINGCATCATTTTCQTCGPNFLPSSDSTACNCPTSSGFVLNGTSCICPTGFNIVSASCISCNATLLPYCASCSVADTCATCVSSTFTFASGNCTCPSPFVVTNSSATLTCACPAGQLPLNGGCIACNITYCTQCQTAGVCSNCLGQTTPSSDGSQCVCNDNTFNITATGQCVCPANTSLLTNTCINCSIQYCTQCSSANICQTCVNNLVANTAGTQCQCSAGQTLFNSNCYTCSVSNCVTCNDTNVCNQCSTNFVPNSLGACVCQTGYTLSGSTCVQCNVTNCLQCQQANVCFQCMPTFTQIANPSSCIPCNITNCTTCSSPNYCSSCSNNLVVNSQGNVCLTCNVANCNLCLNSFTCSSCSVGYQLYNNSRNCIACNLPGCTTCTPTGTCQTCMIGYSLSSTGACTQCTYPCATCTTSGSSTVCASCLPPYSSTPNSNGQCYFCNIANCAQCSSTNPNICVQCATNYQTASGGASCVYNGVCSQSCVNCAFNTYCALCSSGYGVNSTNPTQCMFCQSYYCATCSSTDYTTCLVCAAGYYLQGGVCYACLIPNCQTCDSTGACLTFQPSTGLVPLIINNVVNAAVCDPGCANCSSINTASCINCKSGYVLGQNNICVPCTYPCLTCAAATPQTCLSCYGNLVLSGNTCTTCTSSSNCLTCSSTNVTQCTSCPNGLSLNNGVCSGTCPVNCLACSSSTVCIQCISGFAIGASGVCLPCVSNCRFCSGTAPSVCLDCGPGFYLNTQNNQNVCTSCPTNCQTCNAQQCLSCAPGYILDSPLFCRPQCSYPCASCAATPSSCASCVAGFTLNSQSQCVAVSTCPGGICYTCPLGYILSSNTCVQCAANTNCARCNPANPSQCYSCLAGSFLNPGAQTCSGCPAGCATCTSSSSCTSCNSQYTLVVQPISSAGVCKPCASPCATCIGAPSTCLSCVQGYSLSGWSCKTNFNFGFGVILNTNLQTFWSNYQQFLTALVNSTANFNLATITSINQIVNSGVSASNTVSVAGIISTTQASNTLGATYQFTYLQNTLAGGKTIAGMQIASGNVAPNGGSVPPYPQPQPTPQPTTNNLAIILGICIPLAIIIIGVIIYFVVVRKSCQKKEETIEYRSNNTTVRQTFELTSKAEPTL